MPAGVYWLMGEIQNSSDQAITMVIEVDSPSLEVVDLYLSNADGISVVYSDIGLNSPYQARPSNHRNIVDTLTFPANSSLPTRSFHNLLPYLSPNVRRIVSTVSGSYTGTNTITGLLGETSGW